MENNMKENWKQEMWERSRDRIAEIYQRVSSMYVSALSLSCPPFFLHFFLFLKAHHDH